MKELNELIHKALETKLEDGSFDKILSDYIDKAKSGFQVLQNRGDHNMDSPVQKEAESAVSAYILEANKMWRRSHAAA